MWNNSLQFRVLLLLALAATPGLTQQQPEQSSENPAEGTIYARDKFGDTRTGTPGANEPTVEVVLGVLERGLGTPRSKFQAIRAELTQLNRTELSLLVGGIPTEQLGLVKPDEFDSGTWDNVIQSLADGILTDREQARAKAGAERDRVRELEQRQKEQDAARIREDKKDTRQWFITILSNLVTGGVVWALTFFLGPVRRSRKAPPPNRRDGDERRLILSPVLRV